MSRSASVADARSLKLTTVGRRTGRPHTVSLWFVAHEGRVYLCTDDCNSKDWCRNILAEAAVSVKIGDQTLRGRASLVDDPLLRELLRALRHERYRGAFMGLAKAFVEVTLEGQG